MMKISNEIIRHESEGYAEIVLTNSKGVETGRALVDIEDIDNRSVLWLFEDRFFLNKRGYVCGFTLIDNKYPRELHRCIVKAKKGQRVSFKNKNKLDLRKNNLKVK